MTIRLKTWKKHLVAMKSCKRGVCWKTVFNDQWQEVFSTARKTNTIECGEQSKFEPKENH